MKTRKILLTLIVLLNQSVMTVQANEIPEPYIVTKFITMVPLERDYSIELIKESSNYQIAVQQNTSEQESLVHQLTLISEEYDALNLEIAKIESGEVESIATANAELEKVIETLFEQAVNDYEGFSEMAIEEQIALISENQTVVEWQQYITNLQTHLNELLVKKADLEARYHQLQYEYDIAKQNTPNANLNEQELNQSLLYPYSMEYVNPDTILLNPETGIDDFLLQIHNYLNQIVPDAYKKVSFEQIYQLFKQQIEPNQLAQVVEQKTPIQIGADTLHFYTYAHELSLQDIETVAQFGLNDYYKSQNLDAFQSLYKQIIETKEGQFNYFKAINQAAYDLIQHQLVNYLNTHQPQDPQTFEKVKVLQNKHQVKLAFYDENLGQWSINNTNTSGFYDEYSQKSLDAIEIAGKAAVSEHDDMNESEIPLQGNTNKDKLPKPKQPLSKSNKADNNKPSSLKNIKDKLLEQPKSSQKKDLAKPKSTAKLNANPKANSSSQESNDKKTSLPSTGENRWLTYLAIGLSIIGSILLIFNRYLRFKENKKYQDTKID